MGVQAGMDETGRESDSAPRNPRRLSVARIRLCTLRSPRDTVSESALTARSVSAAATAPSALMDCTVGTARWGCQ